MPRGRWPGYLTIIATLCVGGMTHPCAGQSRKAGSAGKASPRTVVIRGATLLTMGDQGVVERGTLILRKGKIATIRRNGRRGRGNPNTVQIDASGKYVTPGLIDAWSSIGLVPGGRSKSGKAVDRASDGLNRFDRHVLEEALRHGVTALHIEPTASRGIVGASALVRLQNLNDLEKTTTEDVCLTIRVGLGTTGPIGRLGEIKALRTALGAAKDYREAWETYDEELETYIKELKAGKTVKLKKKEEKKAAAPPKTPPQRRRRPGRRRRRPRPRESEVDRKEGPNEDAFIQWLRSPDSFAQAASDHGLKTCVEHPWIAFEELCPEDHEDHPNDGEHDELDPLSIEQPFADDAEKKPAKKDDAKKDKDGEELTKPDQPASDADKEILVKALKRELPVCFEAHRPADILNVLALANEFNLDASISGASGAAYVADELARAEVPVILGRLIPAGLFDRSHTRDLRLDNASRLATAGVSLAIGSGSSGGSATHYLSQNAAIAVGHGLDRDQALRAVTIQAARVRGAADKIGSLEVGKLADVVIWSGYPLAADSVVERVFIGGVEVYHRGE